MNNSNVEIHRQPIRPWDERINRLIFLARHVDWGAILAFVIPFTLYSLTLAPTIYNLDSAELTTAVATGGILRATGYPLYLVLGKIWSFLPLGDIGFRMNLFSAFWAAWTIFLADRILHRLNAGAWARLGALGLLTAAPFFWSLSLIAEVYTLHTAIMAAAILTLIRWGERPTFPRLALPIFLLALSLGNHAATVLLIPGCVWYVIHKHPRQLLAPKFYLTTLLALISGATIFLYLPIQFGSSPAFNYAGRFDATGAFNPVNLQTLDGILWLATGRAFAGQMFGYSLLEVWPEVSEFGRQLWIAFLGIGILPGLVGLIGLIKRDRSLGGMLVLMLFANALFYINYRVVDKQTMYLPVYVLWALGLGYGYQLLIDWFRPRGGTAALEWLFRGVMVGAVALSVAWNWSRVDLSDDWSTREQSEAILAEVGPDAIIFGWWDTIPAVQYLQLVEGQRPDVLAVNRFLIDPHDMNQLIRQEIGERPIYINNPSIELLKITRAARVGSLYRLEPQAWPATD
ncbi:MAG: DUF2723 domain-containing protein [Anaerolineales bacterium]|nr:DUF2723 domain-containing protein [Anaerolineales bacterium]